MQGFQLPKIYKSFLKVFIKYLSMHLLCGNPCAKSYPKPLYSVQVVQYRTSRFRIPCCYFVTLRQYVCCDLWSCQVEPPNTALHSPPSPNTTAHFKVPKYRLFLVIMWNSQHCCFLNNAIFSPVPRLAVLGGSTVIVTHFVLIFCSSTCIICIICCHTNF